MRTSFTQPTPVKVATVKDEHLRFLSDHMVDNPAELNRRKAALVAPVSS